MSKLFLTIKPYIHLMRLDKPIGLFLLLWPTLWGLWFASRGFPDYSILIIFVLGVILMRSAGCVINDFVDRKWDAHVQRTKNRPLATGKISAFSALILFVVLCVCALGLVLFLNALTIQLAFLAVAIIIFYPFMKRFTYLPQLGLGAAFAWSIPMAFAAVTNTVPGEAWLLFFATLLWPVIYDTQYAMVDQDDDIKIGIKSTAILWGKYTKFVIGALQILFIWMLIWVGLLVNLKITFYIALIGASLLFYYQLFLINDHDRTKCFRAFLNNNWVGFLIFLGFL